MSIEIQPISALHDNYIWMIVHPKRKQAIIVDPGEAAPVMTELTRQHLSLAAIFITHHHWDHTNGIAELLNFQSVPVYGPSQDLVPLCDHPLQEGDKITIDDLESDFRIMAIPGHTLGHIAFVGVDYVFCGDTLFTAGCGRLFEGSAEQMHDSLTRLSQLPGDTAVYCGHEYTQANLGFAALVEPNNANITHRQTEVTQRRAKNLPTVPAKISLELATNPFLRAHVPTVKTAAEKHAGKSLDTDVEVFAVLRHWKDNLLHS